MSDKNSKDIEDVLKEVFKELHLHELTPLPDDTPDDILFVEPKKLDLEFPPKYKKGY